MRGGRVLFHSMDTVRYVKLSSLYHILILASNHSHDGILKTYIGIMLWKGGMVYPDPLRLAL